MAQEFDKGPRFLLAENPLADEIQGVFRLYIFHNRSPYFLAKVIDSDNDGTEIRVVKQFGLSEMDAETAAKLMRDMGEWYKQYIDWEDAQGEETA